MRQGLFVLAWRFIWATSVFFFAFSLQARSGDYALAGCDYPGDSRCASADGNWSVTCVSRDDRDMAHQLLIHDKSEDVKWSYLFGRGAQVSWAPASACLAVTDFVGSDSSDIFMVDCRTGVPTKKDLYGLAHKALRNAPKGEWHFYMVVVKWSDDSHVVVHAWGHADGGGGEYDKMISLKIPDKIAP